MKINNIIMWGITLLLGTTIFTSCSNDDEADFKGIDYERVYMENPGTTTKGSVLKTPIGYISAFSGKIAVRTSGAMDAATNVSLAVDNSLVDSYNTSNSTEYKTIPEGVVSLEKANLTVAAGKVVSDTINIVVSKDGYSKLTAGTEYLIPVTIEETSGSDAHLAKEAKFRSNFFVLKYMETNSLIRTEGSESDFQGSPSTDAIGQSWKCIAADDLDPEGFAGLFTGSQWDRSWPLLNGKEVLTASFTIDLNDSHKIGGFSVGCELAKVLDIKLSADNKTWTDVGDTKDAAAIRDSNWNSWYAFYASLPGRYVKITMTLDPDNWAWQYAEWGYCALNSFKLLLDD